MLRRIHWVLISHEGPTKISVNRCLNFEMYSALVEYENEKAKPAHYLIQIIEYDDLDDQRQEWAPERWELVINPALARSIGFFNIYHQCWALIEQGKMLLLCGNTTFAYGNEFKEYKKVERAVSEDIFDYLFDVRAEKFLLAKGKKYLVELFEKRDPEHLKQLDKDFEDYLDNNGMKNIIRDEDMQNLNNDD